MEKEYKVSDLAEVWGVSVPTIWTRVRKENLKVIKKVGESKREVAFVVLDEEILNKYIYKDNKDLYKDNKEVNKDNNSFNYEDNLRNDKVYKDDEVIDAEYVRQNSINTTDLINVYKDVYDKFINMNKDYNKEIKNLYEELSNYKSKELLLTEQTEREGIYLAENSELKDQISELKQNNKKLNLIKEWLIYILITLIFFIIGLLSYLIIFNKDNKEVNKDVLKQETVQPENGIKKEVQAKPVPHKK